MTPEIGSPAPRAEDGNRANSEALSGASNCSDNTVIANSSQQKPAVFIDAKLLPDGGTVRVKGRVAWALNQLIRAGSRGCTPIDNPAPRWSGYVHRIRQAGIVVETVHESHGGPYAGNHARYVLRSEVEIADKAGL